jgi:mitochondrial fission protein ELM1
MTRATPIVGIPSPARRWRRREGGEAAPHSPKSAWVVSDGRAGHEIQSLGIIEALGVTPEIKRIAPRRAFSILAPFGPIDPREASLFGPPFPDLLIAAGRRAIPYLHHVKRASGGRTFTVYVNAPATGLSTADIIVAPRHDGLRGKNVIAPLTPANRITPALLAQARAAPDPRVAALPAPRVALLVGGDSRHHRFSKSDIAELTALAGSLVDEDWSVMATVSRRTPQRLVATLREALDAPQNSETRTFLWEGGGQNPYLSLLARADAIVVTADSVNMVSEAASTGAPVHVFEPSGGHRKITAFLDGLEAYGAIRRWRGRLEQWSYEPLNSTPAIAAAIAEAYGDRHACSLGRLALSARTGCGAADNG